MHPEAVSDDKGVRVGVSEDTVAKSLEAARRDLLDLGLRNPLLNFRLTKRRGVEVVTGDSAKVYDVLVAQQKVMYFASAEERIPDEQLPSLSTTERANLDRRLNTAIGGSELQRRLLATFYDARTSLEETGVNILYLALGMLTWYEDDNSEQEHRAPLLLIPVGLERKTIQDRVEMAWTEDDIGANLSLAMKVKTDFNVDFPEFPCGDDFDLAVHFNKVAESASAMRRWSIDPDAIVLGFFSFSKFLMFNDLDASCWPDEAKPFAHPDIRGLLQDGFTNGEPPVDDSTHLDQFLAPADSYHVVDADSTQTLALLDCSSGRSMVIQGPPGTGKSQTITNLIAQAIAAGKRVLFVSEKMAALEVVKRRLDTIGLGDACLELHSNKTNKKAVLEELKRTLELGRPKVLQAEADLQLLGEQRAKLNSYCEAVNLPIGPSGVSPHTAMGASLLAREELSGFEAVPTLRVDEMLSWDATAFLRLSIVVGELQARVAAMGDVPAKNPFWSSSKKIFLPSERDDLLGRISVAADALNELASAHMELSEALGIEYEGDKASATKAVALAEHVLRAPNLSGVNVGDAVWLDGRASLAQVNEAGARIAALHARSGDRLIAQAWDYPALEARQSIAAHKGQWFRFTVADYRKAMTTIGGLCLGEKPTPDEALELADAVLKEQADRRVVEEAGEQASKVYGPLWAGIATDWPRVETVRAWATALHVGIANGVFPAGSVDRAVQLLSSGDLSRLSGMAGRVREGVQCQQTGVAAIIEGIELDERAFMQGDSSFLDARYDGQLAWFGVWASRIDELQQVAALNIGIAEARNVGLAPVADAARDWSGAGSGLSAAFRKSYYESLLDNAFAGRPELATFDAAAQDRLVGTFRKLDETVLRHNRARVLLSHWEQVPRTNGHGQMKTLRHEFEKKRRHKPVRKLVAEAGLAIQAIKPVFMMSPLSVATYLPPATVEFDVVVFDEASQVRPVDAFGAIVRGKQSVVVGDSRQLPPSTFFDHTADAGEEDDDLATTDIESILGLFEGQGAHTRMLRWHYRSRHESLIAVSNHEFYDDRLVVFPSPMPRSEGLGLTFHHLPNTAWERGASKTNPLEAEAVAQAVMAHARRCPEKTLGVAAFSRSQADAIQEKLELLRRTDPSCEGFFAGNPHEPFFIKNLENVQGDERAVILISVGYGRTAEGYLAMQFGPLLADGGWRRLNVLITRARERCSVFSNLTADDIDLTRTQARGVRSLKAFLHYAQHGILDVPIETGKEADSPFEEDVAEWLKRGGYEVAYQVGSGGFFIDLAVRDCDQPGRFVLGIECDGATYHSARSARDRDRLRQAVLENLGWRIHRIWSTDWFRDPQRQFRLLAEAIEAARLGGDGPPKAPGTPAEPRQGHEPEPEQEPERDAAIACGDAPPASAPYKRYTGGPVQTSLNPAYLNATVGRFIDIVQQEGPLHVELAARRWSAAMGYGRLGKNILQTFNGVFSTAVKSGLIDVRGKFVWPEGMVSVPLRDRSSLEQVDKKIAFVPPEEIAEALRVSVADGLGLTDEEATVEAARLLGFARTGADIRAAVSAVLTRCEQEGVFVRRGALLTLADSP